MIGIDANDTICDGIGADITGGPGADTFTFWNMDGATQLSTDCRRAQGDRISFEIWNFRCLGSGGFTGDWNAAALRGGWIDHQASGGLECRWSCGVPV